MVRPAEGPEAVALAAPAGLGAPGQLKPLVKSLLKAGLLAVALLGGGLLLRQASPGLLRAVHPDIAGAAVLVLAGGVMTAAGLPRQVLAFSAGYVFGAAGGTGWALLGQMLGCVIDYALASSVAGGWARRRIAGRWRALDRFVVAHPFTATLTLRLLPVGNNVVLNLLAGVVGVGAAPFLAASLLGYVPQTVIFALLGCGVQVGRSAQLAAGVGLFIASAALGVVLWRRQRPGAEP